MMNSKYVAVKFFVWYSLIIRNMNTLFKKNIYNLKMHIYSVADPDGFNEEARQEQ